MKKVQVEGRLIRTEEGEFYADTDTTVKIHELTRNLPEVQVSITLRIPDATRHLSWVEVYDAVTFAEKEAVADVSMEPIDLKARRICRLLFEREGNA
ncbi:MAG: hypothetical protein AB7G93_09635 [Bdellovibrionales bacterium]